MIPHLSWQTWIIIVLVGLIFLILESSYRLISPKLLKIKATYDQVNCPDCRASFNKNVLFRVGLYNYGNLDIEGVKVKLRVLPPNNPFHKFPIGEQLLKPKDYRESCAFIKEGLRIHPGDTPNVFIDVAYLKEDGSTELQHILEDIPNKLPPPINQYMFSLSIEGNNLIPVSQIFHIDRVNGIQFANSTISSKLQT